MKSMLNKYQFICMSLSKFILIIFLLWTQTYAQQDNMLQIKSGDLLIYVDKYRGNFSVFDVAQSNLDYASLLFGGAIVPSSFLRVYIDEEEQTLDQMEALYPLGVSLGSQIDGIFLAGEQKDVRIEIAFFSMDLLGNSDFNTIGLAINISNVSESDIRNVGVKIMLDTDIGESRNNSLIHLPTGEKITNAFIFGTNNIPPFLFIGQKNIAEQNPIGQGFYLYPFISQELPSSMIVANWRRLVEQTWNIDTIDPSFSYRRDSTKDMGVSLCFGKFDLLPNESKNIGTVLSKNYTILWPVIEEQVITQGVFNENRFTVEEILESTNPPSFDEIFDRTMINEFDFQNSSRTESQQQRRLYRRQRLGLIESETSTISSNILENLLENEPIWKQLYQLNWKIQQQDREIERVLQQNRTNPSYTPPPSTGITIKERYLNNN